MTGWQYNFPEHRGARSESLFEAMLKVREESYELCEAVTGEEGADRAIEECLDTMHACETLLRRYPVERVKAARDAVVEKNRSRGYYGEGECASA